MLDTKKEPARADPPAEDSAASVGQHDTMNSALGSALAEGRFVVTAEIGPPRDADPEAVTRKAGLLRGCVDAVNITDNQGANVRMSSLAASLIASQAGVEPVMQLTCRDRNRLALQSDLLAAGALGIPNVLLMTGDHPSGGDHPDATPVFDLDGIGLTAVARAMRDDGVLMSGQRLRTRPNWLIGTVENPFGSSPQARARRLADKVAAGAEFVQTQYVFDIGAFATWMTHVHDLGLCDRCKVIAGTGPVRSVEMLVFLCEALGVHVPEDVVRRLRGVPSDQVAREGTDLCVETIQHLAAIPGVAGVHLMAPGAEQEIPAIVERAGVLVRAGGVGEDDRPRS